MLTESPCMTVHLSSFSFSSESSLKMPTITGNKNVVTGSEAGATGQARPSHNIAPTAKLTDDNNTARPELAFQRKAVQDFCMHQAAQAQETGHLPNPST